MSNKTKQQLLTENNANFPNNNSGFITPEKLRTFNGDVIDSTVNQDVYLTDSQSFDTRIGESVVTASISGDTLTFTKDNGNTFDIVVEGATLPPGVVSGSSQINYPQISNIPSGIISSSQQLPAGLVSGSSQVVLQSTTGNLSGSRIDGLVTSASFAISSSHSEFSDNSFSASYALSASHAELADNATNSTFSVYSDNTIVYGKNVSGISIPKGTPLYFTGSGTSGNLVGVFPADAGNPLRMPAGGVAGETLGVGLEGIVILDGFINNVNTSTFQSGQTVYVGVGGGYTNIKPTGSNNLIQALGYVEKASVNGSGVIKGSGRANDVPNIQQGYAWVGNSNGVATPSPTQSIVEHIFTQDNTFTGTQNFTNIAVSGTGSFAYIESVTGSAKVIGDAFIVLNNNTPTERYAGLIVIDSGSTLASASFQFDGLTNDWFYEYTSALDADNFGVVLFGPEYGTKGSPLYPTNNRIQKGDGGHHILDSNISDDGTTVSINSNTQITGSLSVNGNSVLVGNQNIQGTITASIQEGFVLVGGVGNVSTLVATSSFGGGGTILTGSFATTGSNTFVGTQNFTQPVTASVITFPTGSFGTGINLFQDGVSQIRFYSGSNQTQVGTWVNMQVNPANGALAISSFPANNHFVDFDVEQTASVFDAPIKGFGGNLRIGSNTTITGSLTISGSAAVDLRVVGNQTVSGSVDVSGSVKQTFNAPTLGTQTDLVVVNGATINGVPFNQQTISVQNYDFGVDAYKSAFVIEAWDSTNYNFGGELLVNGETAQFAVVASGSSGDFGTKNGSIAILDNGNSKTKAVLTGQIVEIGGGGIGFSPTIAESITIGRSSVQTVISGSLNIESSVTASLQQGFILVGNSSGRTSAVSTGSFATTSGNTFNGNQQITGSLSVSGSINNSVNVLTIASNTASIDASVGNTFVLNLVSGSDTRLEVSNVNSGQTLNLLVSQSNPFGGTLTLAPNLLEPSGSEYTASQVNGAQDILTLASFITTDVMYVANINNLI